MPLLSGLKLSTYDMSHFLRKKRNTYNFSHFCDHRPPSVLPPCHQAFELIRSAATFVRRKWAEAAIQPSHKLTYRRDGHKLGGEHWADIPNAEFFRKGHDVNITPLGNQSEYFFAASGRRNHHHAERRIGKIAPGMGDALAEGDSCARCGVKGFVAARDVCRAFQNNEMLVLILMNVRRRAVTRVRDDLKRPNMRRSCPRRIYGLSNALPASFVTIHSCFHDCSIELRVLLLVSPHLLAYFSYLVSLLLLTLIIPLSICLGELASTLD